MPCDLGLAAFGAGVLNAVAARGTFLTFPALAGIPAIAANATSAVAVLPRYLAGAAGFCAELRQVPRARLTRLSAVTLDSGINAPDGILERAVLACRAGSCAVRDLGRVWDPVLERRAVSRGSGLAG